MKEEGRAISSRGKVMRKRLLMNTLFVFQRRILPRGIVSTMTTCTKRSAASLIDVDCNLWHEDLKSLQGNDEDPLAVLVEDAVSESNIIAMLSPSSTLAEAKRGLELLHNDHATTNISAKIRTTVGIHPYHAHEEELTDETIGQMREMLRSPHCAAVGECGLDASEGFPPLDLQLKPFEKQIQLATELSMPIFVHERLAFQPCLELLEKSHVPVIIHCFTGTRMECEKYIERGYYMSLSGYIFKEEAEEVRLCLREGLIPLDRLMIETDAPYLGFTGCRDSYVAKNEEYVSSLNSKKKKRLLNSIYPNLPSSLPYVLREVLKHLNFGREERGEPTLTEDELALQTSRNANAFFAFGLDL